MLMHAYNFIVVLGIYQIINVHLVVSTASSSLSGLIRPIEEGRD